MRTLTRLHEWHRAIEADGSLPRVMAEHSQRIKTALAARRARGASIGRPKKLMPDQCKEALQRLESGESRAAVARSYGLSQATVNRMVRSARPSGGLAP